MKIAIVAALITISLPSLALAQSDSPVTPAVVCVLKSEAMANFNVGIDMVLKMTGDTLTAERRAAIVQDMLNDVPPNFHIVETRADCPKGTKIYHPSLDPSANDDLEDNN